MKSIQRLGILLICTASTITGQLHAGLSTLLPEQLRTADNKVIERDALEGKLVGIYFSASWCPPCQNFTPELVKLREAHPEVFQVVLVGFDRTEASHWKYMRDYKMNFLSMAPGGRESQTLAERFGVRGIPHLAIIGPDGTVIEQNAVRAVSMNSEAAIKRWKSAAAL